ncbi:unnamed protein product [Rotaria sp. Silwood2]|nr:unnamed protein product [Rotaria sp. Silwood2]
MFQSDALIIPLVSYGLKQSLIERAGNIIRQEQQVDKTKKTDKSDKNLTPFFIETTASNLVCKIVLFSNWSPLEATMNDDSLREHIRKFISKSIEYIIVKNEQSNIKIESIAFAAPDSCKKENILAEEMIYETKRQIELTKSSLRISFILLPDQQTLYHQFLTAIQKMQSNDGVHAVFSCPITNDFKNWNQYMINTFYKYCYDRCVLPKTDDDKRIRLIGPINNVYDAKYKYHLTNVLIQEKIHLQQLLPTTPRPRPIIRSQITDSISIMSSSICYNIMLSYCQEDSIISQRLADRLIDEGFSVWIDLIESNDTFSQINKSECIILCISENYVENKFSLNTVEYAKQMGKHIILVKVQNYTSNDWLQQLIPNEIYFQLFGSENHFDLQYDKLLLKILQYTQPGYASLLQKTSNGSIIVQQNDMFKYHQNYTILNFLLISKQRESNYQKYVMKLMNLKKGKIDENERKILINEIEEIIHATENKCKQQIKEKKVSSYYNDDDQMSLKASDDESKEDELEPQILFESGILSYQCMLKKALDLKTKQNIAPFTISGDINDAPFSMIDEVLQNSKLLLRSRITRFNCGNFTPSFYKKWNFNISRSKSLQRQNKNSPEQKDKNIDVNDDKPNIQTILDDTTSVLSFEMIDNARVQKLQDFEGSTKTSKQQILVKKDFPTKGTYSEQEIMEFRKKFVQRMKDNENELIQLCEEDINRSHRSSKQPIHVHSAAIFSLSTVPDSEEKSTTISQIHDYHAIPLKFPWNGIFDKNAPSLIRKHSSTLFFFEVSQPQ